MYFDAVLHLVFKLFNWGIKYVQKHRHASVMLSDFSKTESKHVVHTQVKKQTLASWIKVSCPPSSIYNIPSWHGLINKASPQTERENGQAWVMCFYPPWHFRLLISNQFQVLMIPIKNIFTQNFQLFHISDNCPGRN